MSRDARFLVAGILIGAGIAMFASQLAYWQAKRLAYEGKGTAQYVDGIDVDDLPTGLEMEP